MLGPLNFVLIVLAYVGLTIGKSVFTFKALRAANHAWRYSLLVAAAWIAVTIVGFQPQCGPLGCGYSVRFGWVVDLLGHTADVALAGQIITATMCAYGLLSVYVFGNLIGWFSYGSYRLFGSLFRLAS